MSKSPKCTFALGPHDRHLTYRNIYMCVPRVGEIMIDQGMFLIQVFCRELFTTNLQVRSLSRHFQDPNNSSQ